MEKKRGDHSGERFGKWTVLYRDGNSCPPRWICQCDCGTVRSVRYNSLGHGSASCGKCSRERGGPRSLHSSKNRLYRTWLSMRVKCKKSCENEEERGERGTHYCEEWDDFDVFSKWSHENGYAPELELGRKDIYADYTPDNCIWHTRKDAAKKRRVHRNSKTGVTGVTESVRKNGRIVYVAMIKANNKLEYLGTYDTLEEAAKVRKAAELKYWG